MNTLHPGILKKIRPLHLFIVLLICASIGGCKRNSNSKEGMNLEPEDKREVYQTTVADADEADILIQQLAIEPLRVSVPNVLFYVKDKNALAKMKELGYTIAQPELKQVYAKLVKCPPLDEATVRELKLQLINREKDHWVIKGTLEQLAMLQDKGVKIDTLDYEPRPREVIVTATAKEDIQKASELGLDIYSAKGNGKLKQVVMTGGAFDYAIDALQKAGFTVEIVQSNYKGK
jgi:hypothetical protein